MNAGLAVDAAGDAYLTGFAGPTYPYTVAGAPRELNGGVFITFGLPFLSKLDPAGETLLFSVPVGGAGVQVDSNDLCTRAEESGYRCPEITPFRQPTFPRSPASRRPACPM